MRQIIAMGGGGFSMEPDNLSLDQYVLDQAHRPRPKICFFPTASGDAESYVFNFYKAFSQLECQPSYLSLFQPPTADLEGFILEKDVLYVGGGNTRSMLALWREWELDIILRKAYDTGVVLAGISAGGSCWFEQCTTDSVPGQLSVLPCLGYLKGSFSPHYDGEVERRLKLRQFLIDGQILPGFGVDNSAAIHFVDERLLRGICSQPAAKAYRVGYSGGQITEEVLDMMYVNNKNEVRHA